MPASTSPPPTRSPATAARLAQIAERAETLSERIARARTESAPALAFAADLLAGWARAFAGGDLVALERRLSWDGLDLELAARAIGSAGRFTSESLPDWLELATRRFSLGEDSRSGGRPQRAGVAAPDLAAVPFGELWAPFVEAALAEAAERIAAEALPRRDLATLAAALASDVGAVGARAAHQRYLRFRQSEGLEGTEGAPGAYGRYVQSELASGLLEFALEFPVALRQIALLVDTWIAALVELAGRIGRDRAALAERFAAGRDPGAVVAVSQPASDRHHGGRGIFRVRFADGTDLVVKPRSLAIEVAWERLLARLATFGFAELPPSARALDCGTHGWMEWIGAEELPDAASANAWFRRAGALVALAELLGAEDLHAENLIAARGGPVVVDAEMLAQPERPGVGARQRFAGGLLRAGAGSGDRIGSWAGLHPVAPRTVTAQAQSWRDLGGDDIAPVAAEIVAAPLPNAPRLAGRQLEPMEYAAALSVGHRRTWEQLLACRAELLAADGPLAELAGVTTRILFRPSQEYATVLDRLKTPRWQREGTSPGILLEAMARPFATAEHAPLAWPLVVAERAMLEALDVPRFEVGADRLEVEAAGRRADGLIRRPTRAAIADRLAALSRAEIDRRADELAVALATPVGQRISLAPAEGPDARARALALADRLAAFERDRAPLVVASPGSPEASRGRDRRLRELALYDGTLGRALVLALADRLDGSDRYVAVGPRLLTDLQRLAEEGALADLPIGGLEGTGAVVWGLVALASLRSPDSAALLAGARRFGAGIGKPAAAPPPVHDLFGGTAGAILALLALAEATQEAVWRERAVALGDGLIAAAQPLSGGAVAWLGKPGEPALTGFAHGSTGIARALSALWQVTGEARFATAVGGALAFERGRFDARLGDWPVVRPGVGENEERRVAMNAYCHGGAGIALGRALLPAGLRDERFPAEVELAVSATVRAGMGDFDHLCCGAAGRLAILGTVGLRLGRADAFAASGAGLQELLARPIRLPGSSRARPEVEAGLFRGLAGVAWLGLFAAAGGDPAVLDPLALELPSEALARTLPTKGSAR